MKAMRVDDAVELLAGDAEPADRAEADADEDGVELALELGELHVAADAHAALDLDAAPRRASRPRAARTRRHLVLGDARRC